MSAKPPPTPSGPPSGKGTGPALPADKPMGRVAASIDLAGVAIQRLRRRASPAVLEDLPCTGCGYNLRGLELGGVCPECGREVAISTGSAARPLAGIEIISQGFHTYGAAHRNTMVAGIGCMLAVSPCLVTVITVIVFLGTVQRTVGLVQMRRAIGLTSTRVASAFRLAVVATACECVLGLSLMAAELFSLDPLQGLGSPLLSTINVLGVLWCGTLGFGMLASAALADGLADHYCLNVWRSRSAVVVAFAAPLSVVAAMALWVVGSAAGSGALQVLSVLAALGAAALWAAAGWAAYCYSTGTADLLHAPVDNTVRRRDELDAVPPPKPYTSPEEQAAVRKAREDDSPIPLD